MLQFSFQIGILVHITYCHNPNYPIDLESKKIIKEYHYYMSNDRKHNILFIHHCFEFHWGNLQNLGVYLSKHQVQSDGYSGEFKSAQCWYHVAHYLQKTIGPYMPQGYKMLWNFFGSSHGKGEDDGACVIVKREFQIQQLRLNTTPFQNAQDVVKFLKDAFAKEYIRFANSHANVMQIFWEVKITNVDQNQPYGCVTVVESRKMQSISSLDHSNLELFLMQELSYFCPTCVDGGEKDDYENIKHALPWKTIKLVPTKQIATTKMMDDCNFEIALGAYGQQLVDSIYQGDNFAIVADDPSSGEKYFLLLCDKPLFTCKETFQDGWDDDWQVGNWLLWGYQYHRKTNSQTFVLLDASPFAFYYFHLVFCTKFAMPMLAHKCKGSLSIYTLECEVQETILQALVDRQFLELGDRQSYKNYITLIAFKFQFFSCNLISSIKFLPRLFSHNSWFSFL